MRRIRFSTPQHEKPSNSNPGSKEGCTPGEAHTVFYAAAREGLVIAIWGVEDPGGPDETASTSVPPTPVDETRLPQGDVIGRI